MFFEGELFGTENQQSSQAQKYRVITRAEVKDKIAGSWIGQMAGVSWGYSTEMGFVGRRVPDEQVPRWMGAIVNLGFREDDLWPECYYMQAMVDHGVNCSWTIFGDYYARSTTHRLWSGQMIARTHLKNGMKAPWTGHYTNNKACDLLSWHITSDFVGNICPGLPESAMDIAWRCGHVTQFGDGVYGGTVPVMMHVTAFFAEDVNTIIQAGRLAAPEGSKYRQAIEDVIRWYNEYPDDWTQTWDRFHQKWWSHNSRGWGRETWNIMTTYNGPFAFIGLLYGEGDFVKSMQIAMQCGMDSDNPISTVGGILGTWIGAEQIPRKWKSDIDTVTRFGSYGDQKHLYNFSEAVETSVNLARDVVLQSGGAVYSSGDSEIWQIPVQSFKPLILEQRPSGDNNTPPKLSADIVEKDALHVKLSAEATDDDGIAAYQWFFGDLQYSAASLQSATISHTYRLPGRYEVTCYVTDNTGNTSWTMVPVQVEPRLK